MTPLPFDKPTQILRNIIFYYLLLHQNYISRKANCLFFPNSFYTLLSGRESPGKWTKRFRFHYVWRRYSRLKKLEWIQKRQIDWDTTEMK